MWNSIINPVLRIFTRFDRREEELVDAVTSSTAPGDLDAAIDSIDDFARNRKWLMNVGDEKGAILDAAIVRAQPRLLLELGTYMGYSALRTARVMPDNAHLVTLEVDAARASMAQKILAHAGVADRVTVVVAGLGDAMSDLGFAAGSVDFVFVDHRKDLYLPDLQRIERSGWLHPGSVVVADNVKYPGAPEYRRYLARAEGRTWRTVTHHCHAEYQTVIRDIVLESQFLG
ncbi:MAG: O-methyltransferase [Nocardiaceae bacterium]|nr:O-methyltransferase [Nocardiaceae bacterium]